MQESFPVWDTSGAFIVIDDQGLEIWLTSREVRQMTGARKVTVDWYGSGRLKKVRLLAPEAEAFPDKITPGHMRRIDPGQPYCVKVTVGDHYHTFMHVRERCASYYDGRPLPPGVKPGISANCL